jgi:hypothetical protein
MTAVIYIGLPCSTIFSNVLTALEISKLLQLPATKTTPSHDEYQPIASLNGEFVCLEGRAIVFPYITTVFNTFTFSSCDNSLSCTKGVSDP